MYHENLFPVQRSVSLRWFNIKAPALYKARDLS